MLHILSLSLLFDCLCFLSQLNFSSYRIKYGSVVSLGKNLDAYLSDPVTFERKAIDKAESEAGAAFFDIRILASYARLASRPSIGGAAQCALDLFYLLFRDKLLDLQAAFPKDMRYVEHALLLLMAVF